MTTLSTELESAVLAHLTVEEEHLCETVTSLKLVRESLKLRDRGKLSDALDTQQTIAKSNTAVIAARRRLRAKLATTLNTPPDAVNLSMVDQHASPSLRTKLVTHRNQLAKLASDVYELNRTNAALARQSIELVRELLTCITGDLGGERYDAKGVKHFPPTQPMFQQDC